MSYTEEDLKTYGSWSFWVGIAGGALLTLLSVYALVYNKPELFDSLAMWILQHGV